MSVASHRLSQCVVQALLFLVVSSLAFAADQYCPADISVKQEATQVPKSWRTFSEKMPHRLAAIGFYDGPPEENASLVSDSGSKNGVTETWRFGPNTKRIWITCSYASTDIALTQELPENTSECTVSYNPKIAIAGHPEIRLIRCKSSGAPLKTKQVP